MLKYEKFKQTIQQIIQQSGLDVGIVYYILKDLTNEVHVLYLQQVQKEYIEEQNKEKESEKDEDS